MTSYSPPPVRQATATSVTLSGLEAHLIQVEVDSGRGLPSFHMVGLPEAAVRESRVRVKAALRQFDVDLSEYVLTVNLAPAYLRKTGSAFDVAIAVGALATLGKIPPAALEGTVLIGELSLNGDVRPVRGVLPALMGARRQGLKSAIVPAGNCAEAASIDGIEAFTARHVVDIVEHLCGHKTLPTATFVPAVTPATQLVDLSDVRGQPAARRALEIAAAGEHNLIMVGPPGSGKTMLARRLPTILPPMTAPESLAVTAIHSVAGILRSDAGIVRQRPFRAPHHTISSAALLGGGSPVRPGEVSLAHHGCLFLDELPEFRRHVLEGLRQPLEDGEVTICRARMRATFPARPLLVAAINPCPCGYAGSPDRHCSCSPDRVRSYTARLSGPLLDRIDLHLRLPPVSIDALQSRAHGEASEVVRERVVKARAAQQVRHDSSEATSPYNACLTQRDLDRVAHPDQASRRLLKLAIERLGLTARGYVKVRRIARTIADLDDAVAVQQRHFAEAIQLRSLDLRSQVACAS